MPQQIERAADPARFQDSVIRTVNPVLLSLILQGRQLGPLSLTTSFQNFEHGLGRPANWIVTDIDASATVWRDSDTNNPDVTNYLRLRASATATVYLWVF
jgi:hypothetical protein